MPVPSNMRWPIVPTLVVAALAVAMLGTATAQRSSATTGRQDLVGKQFDAIVSRVGDGDTLDAVPVGESRSIRMRLEGVDAPEQGEAFGREAMGVLRTLLVDQRVRVHGRDLDRYGRLIARIVRGDVDASVRLVRAGLACHAYAYDALLAEEEAQARRAGTGFWAASARKPACVTDTAFSARQQRPPAAREDTSSIAPAPRPPAATFRGNVSSHVYHAPSCPNYTCRNCTQVFATEAAAKAAGYRPASDCLKP
jgi:micrococcal nuclease